MAAQDFRTYQGAPTVVADIAAAANVFAYQGDLARAAKTIDLADQVRREVIKVPGRGDAGDLELDAAAIVARAASDEIKAKLRANTDEAVERGAYGVPTFFVGDEMFVGNDRLMFVEAALRR